MNIKRIKDAGYKSPYSVAIKINGKDLSVREEGGQTKIFRNLQGGGDVYLYARQNSDGTFDLTYNDHSKYMQSRSTADNVEESLGTYTLVDVLNMMADFKGPVDDYFFARESSVADSRRISDYLGQYIGESQYKDKYIELANMLYEMIPNGLTYHEANEILEGKGLVLVEYGGENMAYAVYAYEDDERFGDYGNSDAGVWIDYNFDEDGNASYVTDVYEVGC